MANVQRQGDANSGGGVITQGVGSVTVDGKPISVTGDSVSCHNNCGEKGGDPHCSAKTQANQGSVLVEGRAVVTTGAADTCGHSRVGGSGTVSIG